MGGLIDRRSLDAGELMLAERLADDLETGGQRRIAKTADRLPGSCARNDCGKRFFRVDEVPLASAQRVIWNAARAASVSRTSKLIAPDFERFARTPWPIASLASSGMRFLSSLFARS